MCLGTNRRHSRQVLRTRVYKHFTICQEAATANPIAYLFLKNDFQDIRKVGQRAIRGADEGTDKVRQVLSW